MISELEALQAVGEALRVLEPLNEVQRERAVSYLVGALGVAPTDGKELRAESRWPDPPDESTEPLPIFLAKHALKTNPEKALAVVQWAVRTGGKDSLSPAEVEDYWRKTAMKLPGNTGRDLGSAVKKGWLVQPEDGRYAATGFGESHLVATRTEQEN